MSRFATRSWKHRTRIPKTTNSNIFSLRRNIITTITNICININKMINRYSINTSSLRLILEVWRISMLLITSIHSVANVITVSTKVLFLLSLEIRFLKLHLWMVFKVHMCSSINSSTSEFRDIISNMSRFL